MIGMVECLIMTVWTRWVTETKVVASGAITFVNILIWYYVLQTIVENINNMGLVLLYAFGCAAGTMLSVYFFREKDRNTARTSRAIQTAKEIA
jgi:uncharacterized protein YebE (UPF0316 family)